MHSTAEPNQRPRPTRALLALTLMMTSGCAAHVALPLLPSRTAPLAEREQALKELTPLVEQSGPASPAPTLGSVWPYAPPRFLLLSNGLRIGHPVDLLPAVDSTSPTAGFVRAAAKKSDGASLAYALGIGTGAVGLGLMFSSLAVEGALSAQAKSDTSVGLALGGAALSLLGLVPLMVGLALQFQAEVERTSAFLMYPRDLRRRLGFEGDAGVPRSPTTMTAPPSAGSTP